MTTGSGVPALGIDLIEIERIERAIARRLRLAARLFRPGELAYAESHSRPARHLAAHARDVAGAVVFASASNA